MYELSSSSSPLSLQSMYGQGLPLYCCPFISILCFISPNSDPRLSQILLYIFQPVFLSLPLPRLPSTCHLCILFCNVPSSIRFICPNHLSLELLITFITCMQHHLELAYQFILSSKQNLNFR